MTRRIAARVASRTLWAMANVVPANSGIANVSIYMGAGTKAGKKLRHGPRVKVESLNGRFAEASVTVDDRPRLVRGGPLPPDIKKQVDLWIRLNSVTLMRLWREEIDQQQATAAVKSIEHDKPVTFFHPSLEATKHTLLPGEFLTSKRSVAKERASDFAIEAGRAEFFVHEVLASVGDQVTRGGTPDVWNASARLPVKRSKAFRLPASKRPPPGK